jgi:hypothetical protein
MLNPIEADHYLSELLNASGARKAASAAPHWTQDNGACFALMAEHGCYPFMVSNAGGGTTITIGGTGQPFTLHSELGDTEAALRYSIVMAVIRKLELAGVRAGKADEKHRPERKLTYGVSDLLALIGEHPQMTREVDADLTGRPITDYDALLWGAYAPAVARIVNLALHRFANNAPRPITADQMRPIAYDAIAQASDHNFAKPPQVLSDYSILTEPGSYTYHDHVLTLVNLALKKAGQPA